MDNYVTFLAGIFRSVRFGIDAAHGGANVIALNYLMANNGISFDDTVWQRYTFITI